MLAACSSGRGVQLSNIRVDKVDRAILGVVQVDARVPIEELGRKVGLSPSATHRRVQRLRDNGVIQAEVAIVNPKALNRPAVMIVELTIDRDNPADLVGLRSWIRNEPVVQQAWYVTGQADFILVVTAQDMEDYDRFIQRLLSENHNVNRFTTAVALNTTKRGLTLPTDLVVQDGAAEDTFTLT